MACLLGSGLSSVAIPAPPLRVIGKVVASTSGEELPGVNVVLKGTTTGTVTDNKGDYVFDLPDGTGTLVFSYIGFLLQEVPVNNRSQINVTLQADVKSLGEVVVVGYGTQKKVNLTGAVSTIQGETIAERTFSNSSKALQGLTPGLTIIDRGGAPGQDGATINIRGVGTLGNASPLILVDNVPVTSIDDIMPNDIASVSVLKDAASAAIYGARAANGVILITTKRGNKDKLTVNYNAYIATQVPTRLPEGVGIGDYMNIINESYRNVGQPDKYSADYIQKTLSGEDPNKYPTTDWLGLIFNPAPQTNHALSLSGGSDKSAFLLSLNYLNQDGIVKNVNAKRYSIRLNNDFTLSKRLKIGTDLSFNRRANTTPYLVDDVYWTLYSDLAPTVVAQYPDGSYGLGSSNKSPVAAAERSGYRNFNRNNLIINLTGSYRILNGLSVNANYSANLYQDETKNYANSYTFLDYFSKRQLFKWNNSLYEENANLSEINKRLSLDYVGTFGKHDLSAILGFQQTVRTEKRLSGSRSMFYANDLQELPLGDPTTRDNGSSTNEWSLQSVFGRINYSLAAKYLLEANFRYDGSSRFAEGRRYGLFPSFSAGWRISEEPFMKSLSAVSNLKLRASWGQLGNQDIGLYQYFQTIGLQENYAFGGGLVNGAAVNTLANRNISWETSTVTNLGLDADFFNGKLGFTAEVFTKQTRNILLLLDIPYTVGLNAPTQNAGVVDNNGYELSASYRNRRKDFTYSVNANFADIRNKVSSLAGLGAYNSSELYITRVGESINSLFGYEALGLFRSKEELDGYARINPNTTVGSVKYKDQNNDGLINNSDKIILGSTIPRFTFGSDINLDYKGIFLSLFVQGVRGAYAMPRGGLIDGPYWGSFITTDWLDRWSPTNPNGSYPIVQYQRSSPNTAVSSFWVQDVSYLRLKNVQIGYRLPKLLTSKIGISNARVYVSGTNLLTLTKAKFVDPEISSGRANGYPQVSMYSLGTNITF